jgi:integrase
MTDLWQREGRRPAVGVWTAEQTAQFLGHVRSHRLYALFHLVAPAGKPVAPDRLTRLFRRLVAESGLPPVTLHGLRHGAATLAQMSRVASDASFCSLRECVRPAAQVKGSGRAPALVRSRHAA